MHRKEIKRQNTEIGERDDTLYEGKEIRKLVKCERGSEIRKRCLRKKGWNGEK